MMRRAARIDANQPSIVEALRVIGATVEPIYMVGGGVPDLLVGYRGVNWLIEVKDGDKPPSRRRLTPDEQAWHDDWRGQVAVVNDAQEAIDVVCGGIE